MTSPPGPRHGPRQPDVRQPYPQQRPEQREQWRQPEPPQPQTPAVEALREAGWVFALRITTYLLTSLASLLFIAMVIYGAVKLAQLQTALSSNPLFGGSSYSAPAVPSQQDLCVTNPDAPECSEGLN